MRTEPDKDVEAVRGALGVLEFRRTRQDALDVLARIESRLLTAESQNQALQREVENKAAILNAIEALLDVDDEHTGWDRIVALQERAENAEAELAGTFQPSYTALQERIERVRVARDALDEGAMRPAPIGEWEDIHNEFMDAVNNLLSPTQETE